MRTRLLALALTVAGVLTVGDRAQAQVIYYETPLYYHSPSNPLVRTWAAPYAYSTYVAPIVVPTRFAYPYWGQVTYGSVTPAGATTTTTNPTTPGTTTGTVTVPTGTATAPVTDASYKTPAEQKEQEKQKQKEKDAGGAAGQGTTYRPPAPAWVQVGHSTYTPAAMPIGSVYYSGDAYIPPSRYYYSAFGTPVSQGTSGSQQYSMYAGYSSPYFSTSYAQGYGGWGNGRGWAGWGRGWGWGQ